ncbi:DUF1672 family protein [Bacillus sp. AP8]|uniref:DUF1672 family protein n=1 Tax=Bacillus sp. AP8 TaxID=1513284 RepID=UPI0003187EA5|nr:DUF1672 family protein [Bacillus sp. AP8]
MEYAIKGALYAMIFEKEFAKLDGYLESVVNELPVVGTPIEAIEKVGGNGYNISFYYLSAIGEKFEDIYNMYMKNPRLSKQILKNALLRNEFKSEDVRVVIYLYMKEGKVEPDKAIFNKVVKGIEAMVGIPKGAYSDC